MTIQKDALPILDAWNTNRKDLLNLQYDQRIHYFHYAHLLILIPESNNKMVLLYCPLNKLIKEKQGGYLYVDSVSPAIGIAGKKYEYQVKTVSDNKTIQYILKKCEPGSMLTPEGRLSWDIPADFEKPDAEFEIKVKKKEGLIETK